MKRKKGIPRQLLIGLVFALLLSETASVAASSASSSIKKAEQEKKVLETELAAARETIADLKKSKGNTEENVEKLNTELMDISARITELEEELTAKNEDIVAAGEKLEEARAREQEQYLSMKERIRYVYENSNRTYVEVLLGARNITELLNAVEYITQMQGYDRRKLKEYRNTIDEVSDRERQLEEDYAELQAMRSAVEENKESVAALMRQKETELASISEDIVSAQSEADYYAAEIQAQDELIAAIRQEEARKAAEAAKKKAEEEAAKKKAAEAAKKKAEEEAAKKKAQMAVATPDEGTSSTGSGTGSSSYTGGALLWPCPASRRVTSDYGPRTAPMSGASTYHRGLDIGAPSGSDIIAAAAGTVRAASYSSAAGNYVMIDHGGGLYTVYMHASKLYVSVGTEVKAGTVIAAVGSTGISTGSHLHFGVSLNGEYVNPWQYLGS